jgi:hypothetical protein
VTQEIYTEVVGIEGYALANFEIGVTTDVGVTTDELPGDGPGNVGSCCFRVIRSFWPSLTVFLHSLVGVTLWNGILGIMPPGRLV